MKILPVSQKNIQSFHGLWGERHPKSKELKYYPYSGQSPAQTEEETKNYKSIVTIMAALPFTAKEFYKYTKNKLSSITKQKLIEKYVVNKGLSTIIR